MCSYAASSSSGLIEKGRDVAPCESGGHDGQHVSTQPAPKQGRSRAPPGAARACGAVVRDVDARGSTLAPLTARLRRAQSTSSDAGASAHVEALSTTTGREKSTCSSRCKDSRWARGGLRLVRACGANLLGGGGSCEPAAAARSRREWVRQRCKGNESCSRVRRCARARSRHRDVTRRAQRPSRVRLRRRTFIPMLRLNAGQTAGERRAELAICTRCGLGRSSRSGGRCGLK